MKILYKKKIRLYSFIEIKLPDTNSNILIRLCPLTYNSLIKSILIISI